MNSIDQINPFVPANRVNRRQNPKNRKDEERKPPGGSKPKRRPGPKDGHQVDELA